MAEPLDIKGTSLRDWIRRRQALADGEAPRRGRPRTITSKTREAIRTKYQERFGQWGPEVLAEWTKRAPIQTCCADTIAVIIADLVPKDEGKSPEPIRYELTASNVMWSEDGTGFGGKMRKRELLVAQDEHSRYKVSHRLVPGPAKEEDVVAYLKEAFDRHGAPLVLKHDGGKIFHSQKVKDLLGEYGVVSLTSPRYYPGYNGRMERSMRDIKQHIRGQRRYKVHDSLEGHINRAIDDLNEDRPRPVLKGRTAREVFDNERRPLPDRWLFKKQVERHEKLFEGLATSRDQEGTAGRRAVEAVLLKHELLEIIGSVSTNYDADGTT